MKKFAILFLAFVLIIPTCGKAVFATSDEEELVNEAREILHYNYVDYLPAAAEEAETMDELLETLDDPYTQYMTEEEFLRFLDIVDQSFYGIGVEFEPVDEGVKILSVLEGSPAEEAGLQPGDIILEADGQSLAGLSAEEVASIIHGDEGTEVELVVERDGEEKEFTLERQKITPEHVDGELKNERIGFLQLKTFGSETTEEFREKLQGLKDEGAEHWMLDLRNNSGGMLDAALRIAGHFIGDRVVLEKRSVHEEEALHANFQDPLLDPPTMVLTNENSASASEALAAAIKDHERGVLIGEETFGKGSVQNARQLSEGILQYTSHRFYSPAGDLIDEKGVQPHVALEDAEPEIAGELMFKSYDYGEDVEPGLFKKFKVDDYLFRMNADKRDDSTYGRAYEEITQNFKDEILEVDRIFGQDRYQTAVEVSNKGWDDADTVVLARGDEFPDALAGVPLAYENDAPILLTGSQELVDVTAEEIERLDAEEVLLLGGERALSPEVEDALMDLDDNMEVKRISGEDRYETAREIAREMGLADGVEKAVVASGTDFPDALAVASHAASENYPILLSRKDSLPGATSEALEDIDSTLVVGGEKAISDSVFEQLPDAERISGADRYETALAIKDELDFASDEVFVAPGTVFPDALTGAVLAANKNSPVLLSGERQIHEGVKNLAAEGVVDLFHFLGGRIPLLEPQ